MIKNIAIFSGLLLLVGVAATACVDDLGKPFEGVLVTSNPKGATDFLIDDMGLTSDGKACTYPNIRINGVTWVTYTDNNDGGDSTGVITKALTGGIGGGCTVNWSGHVTSKFTSGFSGIQVGVGTYLANAVKYEGVAMTLRGDGKKYRLKIPMQVQDDQTPPETDAYGVVINCGKGDGQWYDYKVPFSKFQQEGWGKARDLNVGGISKIQLQTGEKPTPSFDFSCDVGELRFYGLLDGQSPPGGGGAGGTPSNAGAAGK